MILRLSALSLALSFACSAQAQMDPSSALILNSGISDTGATSTTLDTGRYTVRPKPDTGKKEEGRPPASRKSSGQKESSKEPDAEFPPQPVTVTVPSPQPTPGEAPTPAPVESARPPVVQAESRPSREFMRRLSLVEIAVAPGFLYTNSESSYYFRHYTLASPSLSVDATVWLNPLFGLHGSFLGTLSGSVRDSYDGSRYVSATQQWFTAGIRSRRFFGYEALSPALTFGIDYFEYQLRVPSDARLREKLSSIGAQLSVEAELPVTTSRAWLFGATVSPKLLHKESRTSANLDSGGNVDANGVGISIGGRLRFEREDAIFWKLSHTVEKDLFSGDAGAIDPVMHVRPSGVGVTNSFTLFQFGYTWGN